MVNMKATEETGEQYLYFENIIVNSNNVINLNRYEQAYH